MPEEKRIGIGSKGWRLEPERRVYKPDDKSPMRSTGGPLMRAQWRPCWVVGETSRSWLVASRPDAKLDSRWATKIPKTLPKGHVPTVHFDGAAVEAMIWADAHRYRIESLIRYASPEQLARIAEVLDYETPLGAPRPDGEPWLIERTKAEGGRTFLVDADGVEVDEDGRPVDRLKTRRKGA